MATSSKRIYAIPTPRASAADHCQPMPPQEILKHSCLTLCGVPGSWCTQGLFEPSEWLSLEGTWFDSKREFWEILGNRLGNRLLKGTTETCVPGSRRKEELPHRRLACGCQGISSEGIDGWWPAAGLRAGTIQAWALSKEVTIIFITSTPSLPRPQVNNREGRQLHSSTEIWLKIYKAWPCPSEQDPVCPSVILSYQEVFIRLLSFSIRGQTDWKPPSQKTNQSNHMGHSFV